MSISPQGYSLGDKPKSSNPFWGEGEDSNVNAIFASASVQGTTADGQPSVETDKTIDGHNITFGFLFRNIIGKNGVSPAVTVTDITGGHRVTITDATSTHTFDIMNGEKGDAGVSPDVSVREIVGGHIVTITDATGSESFTVMNGTDGSPGTPGAPGAPGADGVTPVITITATQDGEPVQVTKTGTDVAPNFNIALTGGGGSASGLVGWGTEVASTENYPAIKHVKGITSESRSETGKQINGQLNDDQYNWIYISGSCDVSIANNTQASDDASVKMAEEDTNAMLSWRSASGFVIDNLVITDNSSLWTFSNIQAKPEFVGASSAFIDSMTFEITCTATDGTVTKTVSGNASINFDNAIPYTTVTTYQNLEVIPEA